MSFTRQTLSCLAAHAVRHLAVLLVLALGINSLAYAAAPRNARAPDPEAIHQQLAKRGLGRGVKVMRLDGSTVTGHIAALSDAAVDLQPGKGAAIAIPLADVKKVQNAGMPTGAKIGIGIGAGILAVALVGAIVVGYSLR